MLECAAAIAAVGVLVIYIRSLRAKPSGRPVVRGAHLLILCTLYGGFLLSSAYHVLMNSINFGVPASTGWYLYAVVVPEATLFVIGLLAFRWGRPLLIGVVAGLFLLEMYATHWLLIPYYTGLIDHAPNGALRSFYLSQFKTVAVSEILTRLTINRPFFVTNSVLILLWCLFLAASGALVYITARESAGSK